MPFPEATHALVLSPTNGKAVVVCKVDKRRALDALLELTSDEFWFDWQTPLNGSKESEKSFLCTSAVNTSEGVVYATPLELLDDMLAKLNRGYEHA
jgi:hypothetical protein